MIGNIALLDGLLATNSAWWLCTHWMIAKSTLGRIDLSADDGASFQSLIETSAPLQYADSVLLCVLATSTLLQESTSPVFEIPRRMAASAMTKGRLLISARHLY